jgi:N-acetylglucosamine-6-sulfatase
VRRVLQRPKGAISLPLLVLSAALLLAACGVARLPSPTWPVGQKSPANIVLFLTDDQRYDMLEYMPIVQRELVARGVNFTNTYATTPLCCPSRASILTGQYAHNHGVLANEGPNGGWRRFNDSSTLATWLQGGGIRTMLIGKYLNLYHSERVPPGWNEWYAIWDDANKYYDYTINNNGATKFFGDKERWYSADILTKQAQKLLQDEPNKPFFLYFSYDGPHGPPVPAKQDLKKFDNLPPQRLPSYNEADTSDKPNWVRALPLLTPETQAELDKFRRNQIGVLQSIDRSIGAIIDQLRADGRLDNTWLIFMSDNGLSLGEHRYGQHKSCGYEECVRLPLVVVPPASQSAEFKAPRTDHSLVLNLDLAPTFAEIQGVRPEIAVDGRSLLPLLTDPAASWRRDAILELAAENDEVAFQGLRSDRWKYLRYDTGEQELYDLDIDPYELENLAARPESAATLADLTARLETLLR